MSTRFKSPIVWAAVLSQLLLIEGLGAAYIPQEIKLIGIGVIEILTFIGILNNPSDSEHF